MKKNNVFLKIFVVFWILALLIGIAMVLIPALQVQEQENQMNKAVENWDKAYRGNKTAQNTDPTSPSASDPIYPELLSAMKAYNQEIFENGQNGLVDAWSYQASVFNLSNYGNEDDVVGVISVPSINVELPLYLGANQKNLSKGFAQLSQTSMPTGGIGTNCVVACHRGYDGAAFLRDADKIKQGDLVYLENYWETLTYEVVSTKVILPDNTDEILIQPERDLLTMVTCTPFRVGSHRLLIFCERVIEAVG